ncbi:DNA alkylation repair protein [Lacticaseibacillus absianus]|uniref:DNA alkylation repair protein n=1 Tax=Lacticaseibacillus absianus TaxID=2729623 RepID=UPI001FE53CC5|nr:DNA alkylation repair protein [Lacticaseibacillus absianus]
MQFELHGEPGKVIPMAQYMKGQFPFVGVQTVARRQQSKPLLLAARTAPVSEVLDWVRALSARTEREYQYVAYDLASSVVRRLSWPELRSLVPLITVRPWWDTVDGWRAVYGEYIRAHPLRKRDVFAQFAGQPDFWLRRVAITLQLMEKGNTDRHLLTTAIVADAETDEFFIQKAIGWALRQYSKTDPAWVRAFLATHALSRLAVREASKFL